eukprot:40387-Pyramimonas_sp.AAC.1
MASSRKSDEPGQEHDAFFSTCANFDFLIVRCNPGQSKAATEELAVCLRAEEDEEEEQGREEAEEGEELTWTQGRGT